MVYQIVAEQISLGTHGSVYKKKASMKSKLAFKGSLLIAIYLIVNPQ